MQGTLNEIDISSILQIIELGQRTGILLVKTYHGEQCGEKYIFFLNGKITYAADETNTSLLRLRDYLHFYKSQGVIDGEQSKLFARNNVPEYAYIWHLLANGILSPVEGRSIIQSMVEEILFDLLSLKEGYFIFQNDSALEPQLTSLEISSLLTKIMKQVQQWKEFHPYIEFPNQAPVIVDDAKLRESLPPNAYQNLERWADGKTSLRQLSRYLNRDILTIAKAIYPYIEKGWLRLFGSTIEWENSELTESKFLPHIVCIDDDYTIGKSLEYSLNHINYKVTILRDSLAALSQVFKIKPDLILCDLVMPNLDGYEICAMLRSSTAFRKTPIIMLTGKETCIARIQAKIAGATDYLIKPFEERELLLLLEKWLERF